MLELKVTRHTAVEISHSLSYNVLFFRNAI